MLRLKVTGISSLTDARYCAGMGVEFLSFRVFTDKPASLSEQNFKAIMPWIEGVKWMGEYDGSDAGFLFNAIQSYDCNRWLLPLGLEPEAERDLSISRFCQVQQMEDSLPDGDLQLDMAALSPENQKKMLEIAFRRPREIMLSNIFLPQDAKMLGEQFPQLIFCLESGLEERPGWMDLSDLQDYLEKLEGDF